jgi:small subunit ribosomal protein S17
MMPEPKKQMRTHGRTFTGKVISDRMSRTVTVAWERRHFVPKFQRYERRYSKVKAHNPDEIDAKMGDIVTIMETKPISKTKHFIVIKKQDENRVTMTKGAGQ